MTNFCVLSSNIASLFGILFESTQQKQHEFISIGEMLCGYNFHVKWISQSTTCKNALATRGEKWTNLHTQDLLVTLSTLLRGSVYERLRWTFKLYDLNGDGCISRNELSEIVHSVHELMGRRPNQIDDDRKAREQVEKVFRKFDLNQDGVITIEEFLETCLKDEAITKSLQMFDTDLWLEPDNIVNITNKTFFPLIDLWIDCSGKIKKKIF